MFFNQIITQIVFAILLTGFILILFFSAKVKKYFSIDPKINILSVFNTKKKETISIAIILMILTGILFWGFSPSATKLTVLNIFIEPEFPQEGDTISLIALVKGRSPIGGTKLSVSCVSYFTGGGSFGGIMDYIGDDTYIWTFPKSFQNGTEIWYLIKSANTCLSEDTITVGHVERSSIYFISINNVSYNKINENNLEISALVQSNTTIRTVEFLYHIVRPLSDSSVQSSSASSGNMLSIENDTYIASVPLFVFRPPTLEDGEYDTYETGTVIRYRIAVKDGTGNTALFNSEYIVNND